MLINVQKEDFSKNRILRLQIFLTNYLFVQKRYCILSLFTTRFSFAASDRCLQYNTNFYGRSFIRFISLLERVNLFIQYFFRFRSCNVNASQILSESYHLDYSFYAKSRGNQWIGLYLAGFL